MSLKRPCVGARLVALLLCVSLLSTSCSWLRQVFKPDTRTILRISLKAAAVAMEQMPDLGEAVGRSLLRGRRDREKQLRKVAKAIRNVECLMNSSLSLEQQKKMGAAKKGDNMLAEALPHACFRLIERSGHAPFLTHAPEVLSAVLPFIGAQAAAAGAPSPA